MASEVPMLVWTAWNNGKNHPSGAGYGLKVPIDDADRFFDRRWKTVCVELQNGVTTELNLAKKSFWTSTCHELISRDIGRWLRERRLAPWRSGAPPKLRIEIAGERRFRVTG